MPLPVTSSYNQRLLELEASAPDVAQLAWQIAGAIKSEFLSLSAEVLVQDLFAHLDPVARRETGCVTRLAMWLFMLADAKALSHAQVATFVSGAASLAGPAGVATL